MAAVVPVAPSLWGTPAVIHALQDCRTFWLSVRSARWSRTAAVAATSGIFQRAAPLRLAFAEQIPAVLAPDLAALVCPEIMFLVPDLTTASGHALPLEWEVIPPAPIAWAPIKAAKITVWKLMGRVLQNLLTFAMDLPAAIPAAAPAAAPAAPADPAVALILQELARQKADHDAALVALNATIAAQAALIAAAPAVAPAVPPLSPELLERIALFESAPISVEAWPLETLELLVAVLDVHATRLASELVASGTTHFGPDPLVAVRPSSFPLLVHLAPQIAVDDPVALSGVFHTVSLLRAFIFEVKSVLGRWQDFIVMVSPTWARIDFVALGAPAVASPPKGTPPALEARGDIGGVAAPSPVAASPPPAPATPVIPEKHRQSEADILAAVRGEDVSAEAAEFTGGSLLTRLTPVRPGSGIHRGLDLRVRPRPSFSEDETPSWEMGSDGRARLRVNSKCKTLEEWEAAFLQIALRAPSKEGGKILLVFHSWFCLRAKQFSFKIMLEFYDFLMRLIEEERASMEEARVQIVWQEFQLRKHEDGVDLFTPGTVRGAVDARPPKVPKVRDASAASKSELIRHCFSFNKAKGCKAKGCKHPHVCSKCGGQHPVLKCTQA